MLNDRYTRSWYEARLRSILHQVPIPFKWLEDNSLYIYQPRFLSPKVYMFILRPDSIKKETTLDFYFFVIYHKTMLSSYLLVSDEFSSLSECASQGGYYAKMFPLYGRLNRIKL